jgi:hypothetical protein
MTTVFGAILVMVAVALEGVGILLLGSVKSRTGMIVLTCIPPVVTLCLVIGMLLLLHVPRGMEPWW